MKNTMVQSLGWQLLRPVLHLLVMVGLAAILNQVSWLGRTIQILGGLYLIQFGVSAWKTSLYPRKDQSTSTDIGHGFRNGMLTGLLVNLSNPKAIAFL
jgi:threonine/homoserine/homoserine lactone efflux protein